MPRRVSKPDDEAVSTLAETAPDIHRLSSPDLSIPLRDSSLPEPGTLVEGKYRVVEMLGQGGMGAVMLARDDQLQRDVAIKFVHSHLLDHSFNQRFLLEARAMARVHHENVVTIYSFGNHDGSPYFVMEFVPGIDLERWLEIRAPLAVDEALGVLQQVCRGVTAIHRAGAVHRDIKPANILVGPGFRLVVTDLGLAQMVHSDTQTTSGGSPDYMAPELIEDVTIKPEHVHLVDIYALGVLAFQLLTGELPFQTDNVRAALYQHLVATPPNPSDVRPDLMPIFDEPVLAALAKKPQDRPPTAKAFLDMLHQARHSLIPAPRPMRVVIADDDEDFLRFAERIVQLELPQATIVTAADGAQALDDCLAEETDLALIDLEMPKLNGLELIGALKASEEGTDTRIIIVTAVGGANDWKVLSALGADAFMFKPVQPEQLLRTISRLLGTDE